MEFPDLNWNEPIKPDKPKKDVKNAIWDFDLLNKSEGDVFDVKFLQSQAQCEDNQGRERQISEKNQVSKAVMMKNDQNVKDEKLAKLVSAGFETVQAKQALEVCAWDMEMAVDMLFNNQSGSPTHAKSPTRQSSEAFGMSVFKGAQKVFDYSKKKITQVVESSKSSGWMNERSKGNERSEFLNQSTSFTKESVSAGSGYSPDYSKADKIESSRAIKLPLESKMDQPVSASANIKSANQIPHPVVTQYSSSTVQRKSDALLIGDLAESSEMKPPMKGTQKNSINQNLGLLDSSIEFVVDNSKSFLNPTPSKFTVQPIKNDPQKVDGPLLSQNIPAIPAQHLGSLKSANDIKSLPSNASLTTSRTTSQKPAKPSNLDSLDPFSGISDFGKSISTTTNTLPIIEQKQLVNDFNILPVDKGKKDPKITNFLRNEPLNTVVFPSTKNNAENTQPALDLLDSSFDFSSASGKSTTLLASSSNAISSTTNNDSKSSKKPFHQSFMIFDSMASDSGRAFAQLNTVSENSSQRSEADACKEKGNQLFKSGQYADAETQYSLGIKSVHGDHPILATLYNNRAGARLKMGSYNEAVQDCNKVQEFEPNEVKSLLRRAQAYEALEKWEEAQTDYRKILVIDPTVKSVSHSLARCAKALQPSDGPVSRPSKAPESMQNILQPTQKFRSTATEVTAAVQYVREKNRQTENEDALKLALKDKIDDKMQSWRKGKEDNLRALLSSLDAVLWKELEWKTINLSEILTPAQVKAKYLRAIGKVHPDKLGSNISVENQLIANSVFSTLNKAWDSFKTQNGM